MEGAIAAAFQQYFGKAPEAIANLMSKCTQVNVFYKVAFFVFYSILSAC